MGKDPSQIRQNIEDTRARMGDTVEALGYKADIPSRMKDSISDKVDAIKSKVTGVGSKVGNALPHTEGVRRSGGRAAGMATENPLGLAVGALALGFLVGLMLPATDIENEKIGDIADDVRQKAKETGREAMDRGKQVAQEATQAAVQSGQRQGKELASSIKDRAGDVGNSSSPTVSTSGSGI
ncbi:MAG: DUF3618 domain-containing protein [Candidatus Eremiobacteraeota bacterium]|nr:DUF3618 domain-containing protein [Candidatus Eremiobacteraeota bacterium]MBC5826400.1 DUF3618 domain-containing protein [Candidatus Eremiobacteraeota bacterium]